tara:strand:- start:245 stop:454 length:210 start_codon:yes stop_codon:yes gene_type:complete
MEVILTIIDKALVVLFILAIFNLIRHGVKIAQNFFSDEPTKYIISDKALLLAGLSASFIIMSLFKGIGL